MRLVYTESPVNKPTDCDTAGNQHRVLAPISRRQSGYAKLKASLKGVRFVLRVGPVAAL